MSAGCSRKTFTTLTVVLLRLCKCALWPRALWEVLRVCPLAPISELRKVGFLTWTSRFLGLGCSIHFLRDVRFLDLRTRISQRARVALDRW